MKMHDDKEARQSDTHSQVVLLQLLLSGDEWLETLNELLDAHVCGVVDNLNTPSAGQLLWRDQDVTNDVDDAVASDAVADVDARKAVDLDLNQAAVAGHVDTQIATVEEGGQVGVEETLWHAGPAAVGAVVRGVGEGGRGVV